MSQALVSVVIPTLNAQACLPRCLDSLIPGATAGLVREVLAVDGGSADATLDIASGAGCRTVACSAPGRGRQLRAGALNARGDWLLFLHADTALPPDWPEMLAARMSAPDRAAAFTLAYDSDAPEARWLERRTRLRCRLLALPYGDQGLFLHRSLYDAIGGYDDIPLMEDVAIVRRIGRRRLDILPGRAVTSAEKYVRDGWRRRAWRNAFLLARYLLGAKPEKLAAEYD